MADELGIDKQKVYRYIKKNHINEAHQKNGVMYYDETVQNSINREFSESEPHQLSASNEAVIDVLLKQSDMLKKELECKNEQIEQLTAALTAAQETQQQLTTALTAAQALHAGTIQQQLIEEQPIKKHWWQKNKNKGE